jgi:hypothetical protein
VAGTGRFVIQGNVPTICQYVWDKRTCMKPFGSKLESMQAWTDYPDLQTRDLMMCARNKGKRMRSNKLQHLT